MQQADHTMPQVMKELHKLEFDDVDGDGIDFQPYSEFLSEEETRGWIRAWTGNSTLDGREYRIFGQDGTGGYAAFWCVRHDATLLEQPIVFFGSEGELGVLASNFADYLWLLAGGLGPYEAIAYPDDANGKANSKFSTFATMYAGASKKPPSEILSKAHAEFPKFEQDVRSLCGYS